MLERAGGRGYTWTPYRCIASLDHIAVELTVLARLYAGDAPAAVVRELLTQHLWPWAPAWLADVALASLYALHRTAARLGVALLGDARAGSEAEARGS